MNHARNAGRADGSVVVGFAVVSAAAISAMVLRCRPLRSGPQGRRLEAEGPLSVSVVIPARDEGLAIGALLDDLACQQAGEGHAALVLEVIVVDDHSRDDTADIARRRGAQVISSGRRPPGWNPKVWALALGAQQATHPELVFLDADVRLAPGAVATIVSGRRAATGLLSVAPTHRAVGVLEALSAPGNIVAVAGGGPGLGRVALGAVGSCLAVSRQDYGRIGGHGAQPATIVDDLALAATARRHGMVVSLRRGGDLVTMRSYPGGLGSLVDGWSKNLAAGMGYTPKPAAVAIGAWITTLVLPLALLARRRWSTGALLWAAVAVHTRWLTGRVGRFALLPTSIGSPLSGLFFTALTVRSVVAAAGRRPVQWKGRALGSDGLELGVPTR